VQGLAGAFAQERGRAGLDVLGVVDMDGPAEMMSDPHPHGPGTPIRAAISGREGNLFGGSGL
jgi:hypothetical protein